MNPVMPVDAKGLRCPGAAIKIHAGRNDILGRFGMVAMLVSDQAGLYAAQFVIEGLADLRDAHPTFQHDHGCTVRNRVEVAGA
jgi:hypothetical protein